MIVRIRIRPARARRAALYIPWIPCLALPFSRPAFASRKQVRVFPQGWDSRVGAIRARFHRGALDELLRLSKLDIRLEHSVIAFTYEGQPGLSSDDRDLLWRAFGVPVFEQRLGANNELLAMECEAHAGLHVVSGFSGVSARVAKSAPAATVLPVSRAALESRNWSNCWPRAAPARAIAILGLKPYSSTLPQCERGGTGRRTRLRIWRPKGHGSSTLPVRTNFQPWRPDRAIMESCTLPERSRSRRNSTRPSTISSQRSAPMSSI